MLVMATRRRRSAVRCFGSAISICFLLFSRSVLMSAALDFAGKFVVVMQLLSPFDESRPLNPASQFGTGGAAWDLRPEYR